MHDTIVHSLKVVFNRQKVFLAIAIVEGKSFLKQKRDRCPKQGTMVQIYLILAYKAEHGREKVGIFVTPLLPPSSAPISS